MKIPKLTLITDGQLINSGRRLESLQKAYAWGLPAIQLREKQLSGDQLFHVAEELNEAAVRNQRLLIINERVDVAMCIGCCGVHLPSDGIGPDNIKKLGCNIMVGKSVHTLEQALLAEKEEADYVLVGPIFSPLSKIINYPLLELSLLQEVSKKIALPVIAVGGISPQNVRACLEHGAHGVAAIGAFSQSNHLEKTIEQFLRELEG